MQANSLMHEREISGRSFELCSQNFGRRLSLGSRLLSASSLERSDKDFKGLKIREAGSPERHDDGRKQAQVEGIYKRFGAVATKTNDP